MRTILLLIEYDGTNYVGWQVQPNGLAVQEVVEKALSRVVGQDIRLHCSGRTDAGVHAKGMPAHFQTDVTIPIKAFIYGVNGFLPSDIAVREAREMPQDFHARFVVSQKWYRYTLYLDPIRSPLAARTSWHLRRTPDLELMRQAAAKLVGLHDFQAFRSSSCGANSTRREILGVEISRQGEFVYLDFRGLGFLRYMVRLIVGTLVDVGSGKRPPSDIDLLLAGTPGQRAGGTAPAQGLCLMEVFYK